VALLGVGDDGHASAIIGQSDAAGQKLMRKYVSLDPPQIGLSFLIVSKDHTIQPVIVIQVCHLDLAR
jgi:hypothetical protein